MSGVRRVGNVRSSSTVVGSASSRSDRTARADRARDYRPYARAIRPRFASQTNHVTCAARLDCVYQQLKPAIVRRAPLISPLTHLFPCLRCTMNIFQGKTNSWLSFYRLSCELYL
ncbi:uncharacterized protein LOC143910669 [Arctopsyche grandis]|uniref:uncharacterized protein LOC143910669 n=1 Tax=Arctopsyche grandis TaxID=121162 RepID=UPI00406D8E36